VTNTEEREERIQVNNNNQMSPFGRQAGPAFPQNFEQSNFRFLRKISDND